MKVCWRVSRLTVYRVSQKVAPKVFWHFSHTVGNLSTKFYTPVNPLLYVHVHAGLQIFILLIATLMKLCYIKCDHNVSVVALT